MTGVRTSHGLRIRAEIPCTEVNWSLVRSVLSGRFKRSRREASRLVFRFSRKLAQALNLEWFRGKKLLSPENEVVAAICEVHGADAVTLVSTRMLRKGGLGIELCQRVEFEPPFSKDYPLGAGLDYYAEIEIRLPGMTLRIRGFWQALLAQSVFFCLGVTLYVIAAFCLLYSFSVFMLFLQIPDIMTVAATRRADIGLGLLSFLVVLAWIFGRAISNVGGLLLGRRKVRSK